MSWAKENPEKHRKNVARWRAANVEHHRAWARAYYQKNKAHMKAVAEARRAADPEKWKAQAAERMRRRRERWPEATKDAWLQQRYRISWAAFQALLKEQHGVCAICHRPETKKRRHSDEVRQLAVDHDHATGLIRGLLCFACNSGVGHLGDDPQRLESAARYLRKHTP